MASAEPLSGIDRSLAESILTLPPGIEVSNPGLLFRKLDEDTIAEWTARFGG